MQGTIIVFFLFVGTFVSVSCINVTVAFMVERGAIDLPFNINRSIGILELGIAKAREIINQTADLTFRIYTIDTFTCTPFKFGAYAAEAYHVDHADVFIGPGKNYPYALLIYVHLTSLFYGKP